MRSWLLLSLLLPLGAHAQHATSLIPLIRAMAPQMIGALPEAVSENEGRRGYIRAQRELEAAIDGAEERVAAYHKKIQSDYYGTRRFYECFDSSGKRTYRSVNFHSTTMLESQGETYFFGPSISQYPSAPQGFVVYPHKSDPASTERVELHFVQGKDGKEHLRILKKLPRVVPALDPGGTQRIAWVESGREYCNDFGGTFNDIKATFEGLAKYTDRAASDNYLKAWSDRKNTFLNFVCFDEQGKITERKVEGGWGQIYLAEDKGDPIGGPHSEQKFLGHVVHQVLNYPYDYPHTPYQHKNVMDFVRDANGQEYLRIERRRIDRRTGPDGEVLSIEYCK